MSGSLSDRLLEIDNRLLQLAEEKELLLNERNSILAQQEVELAKHFNQHVSPEAKVDLFISYFKGRNDVYPFRWESQNGRSGYSPACWNEWKPKVCNKPRISCTECSNQQFKHYDGQAIFDHLKGNQTIGIYPLLENNTSHILAVDFDKDDWIHSVKAFSEACDFYKVPHIIERSRSGNGGHVWIFFSQAVEATKARKLGNGLLTKAMEMYPALSFTCFDRLFPNQDVMPGGGFGNLIALPLQLEPRKQGNSVFIDSSGVLYKDQWAKLASIQKVDNTALEGLLSEITLIDEKANNELADKPWKKLSTIDNDVIANCPEEITLVIADQIYIPIDKLPGKLTSRLKYLAVFSNPEFYKRQGLRLSTIGIPRYICAAHIEGHFLILPRGCLSSVEAKLTEQKIEVNLDDKRFSGDNVAKVKFTGKLKSQQNKAVNVLLESSVGILEASTGFGKTVTALALIAKRKVNTLILVHSRQLAEQWLERINVFLKGTEVGSLLGGKEKLSYQVDVATYQSLVSRNGMDIKPYIEKYGQIIVDECHHLPASNYESLIKSSHAKFIHGFTATPKRQDGLEKLMMFQLGDIVYKGVKSGSMLNQQVIAHETDTTFPKEWLEPDTKPHISQIYKHLVNSDGRNQKIVDDILSCIDDKRSVMVLTERKEHIEHLSALLTQKGLLVVELHGGISAKQRQERIAMLEENKDLTNDKQVILATGKYVGEGFDLPYLNTLFITLPIAWKGILAQYAGRIGREWSNKNSVQVYDYLDTFPTLKRMFSKREKGYKLLGYEVTYR
ncbi:TOTE conflict system archaeo-eukaryotic primase domain-containing protein [Flocculibacter collagenilyticus]|uniref:TOTE conflict system archaeo-eukaryotic primase domain-containing protein n=1 Tax=Flocculibacter collagenilyticus TaxID=2744479 RepID=UPI001F199DBF|nr:DEAD/DEAH box helicase [Flocculibacter collagenilyticus]